MFKTIKLALSFGAILVATLAMFSVHSPARVEAAPPKCFSQQTSGTIVVFPVCEYDPLSGSAFVMGSLPNPLADDQCYYWTNDSAAPGQVVSCADPQFANAAGFGSNTPPPVSLENAQRTVAQNALDNPQRVSCTSPQDCVNNNPLIWWLIIIVNVMSAAVGVIVIIMIVLGGIQYSAAGGNPNATAAAKKRILNAILALVAYFMLFMAFQWLVPGGIL